MILYRIRDTSGELYFFTERSRTFASFAGLVSPGHVRELAEGQTIAAKDVPQAFLKYDPKGERVLVEQSWGRFRSGESAKVEVGS